jgi:general secretion pathway protein A
MTLVAALALLFAFGGPREVAQRLGLAARVEAPVVARPITPASVPVVAEPEPDVAAAPPANEGVQNADTPTPTAPAAAPSPPRIDDLASALALRSPGATVAASYAAILRAWSVPAEKPAPDLRSFPEVIGALDRHGLAVFSFSAADLDVLRVIDHPVLLGIDAADGERRIVALSQLSDDEAVLEGVVESGPVRVPIDELLNSWLGDAHLVWRDFEPLPEVIRPGEAGDGVAWLQQALTEAGFSPGSASGRFDAATEEAVRAFQEDRHLNPDGAVGPLTKMALYRATGRYAVPHVALAARAGDAG